MHLLIEYCTLCIKRLTESIIFNRISVAPYFNQIHLAKPQQKKGMQRLQMKLQSTRQRQQQQLQQQQYQQMQTKFYVKCKWHENGKRPKHLLPNVQVDRDGGRETEREGSWGDRLAKCCRNGSKNLSNSARGPRQVCNIFATNNNNVPTDLHMYAWGLCVWVCLLVCHLPFGIFHLPASLVSAVYGYQWTLNCSHEICNCNCAHA